MFTSILLGEFPPAVMLGVILWLSCSLKFPSASYLNKHLCCVLVGGNPLKLLKIRPVLYYSVSSPAVLQQHASSPIWLWCCWVKGGRKSESRRLHVARLSWLTWLTWPAWVCLPALIHYTMRLSDLLRHHRAPQKTVSRNVKVKEQRGVRGKEDNEWEKAAGCVWSCCAQIASASWGSAWAFVMFVSRIPSPPSSVYYRPEATRADLELFLNPGSGWIPFTYFYLPTVWKAPCSPGQLTQALTQARKSVWPKTKPKNQTGCMHQPPVGGRGMISAWGSVAS